MNLQFFLKLIQPNRSARESLEAPSYWILSAMLLLTGIGLPLHASLPEVPGAAKVLLLGICACMWLSFLLLKTKFYPWVSTASISMLSMLPLAMIVFGSPYEGTLKWLIVAIIGGGLVLSIRQLTLVLAVEYCGLFFLSQIQNIFEASVLLESLMFITVPYFFMVGSMVVRNQQIRKIQQKTVELKKENAQRKSIELELRASKEQAIQANIAKSTFLANMSHEIRTPMNAILGMINLSLENQLEDETRDFLGDALSSANGLLVLLNDILDLSKIESGKTEIVNANYDIEKEIQKVVSTFSLAFSAKGIYLEPHLDPRLPKCILADQLHLRQVLVNLVGNAFKFTHKGGVKIQIENLYHEGDIVTLLILVIDTGTGIPEEKYKRIFEDFSQADATVNREYGGTGLGLAISQKLVHLMGGELWVLSQLGEGSCFGFTLPCKVSESSPQIEASVLLPDLSGTDILLVEDNRMNQKLMLAVMSKAGVKVDVAGNGKICLEMLAHGDYQVVLMDLQMPEMGGIEATGLIRGGAAGDHQKNIPIIAMTANAFNEDKRQCLEAGMNDFISKPVKKTILFTTIQKYLQAYQEEA